jgi:hypothetical protein
VDRGRAGQALGAGNGTAEPIIEDEAEEEPEPRPETASAEACGRQAGSAEGSGRRVVTTRHLCQSRT